MLKYTFWEFPKPNWNQDYNTQLYKNRFCGTFDWLMAN